MPWTYILECRDKSLYVGSGWDLVERLRQHQNGRASKYTKRRRPVTLVWAQEFDDIDEAFIVEQQLKGWGRAKKVALIEGRFQDLPQLAARGPADPAVLSDEWRRRVEAEAKEEAERGAFAAPTQQGFETSPVDAVTKSGRRIWVPRAVARARSYEQ